MKSDPAEGWSRRDFVRGLTLAGTAGLVGLRSGQADADPPPETTRLRLYEGPVTCLAPQYVAQELLLSEGFTDVRYAKFSQRDQGPAARDSRLGRCRCQPVVRPHGPRAH